MKRKYFAHHAKWEGRLHFTVQKELIINTLLCKNVNFIQDKSSCSKGQTTRIKFYFLSKKSFRQEMIAVWDAELS